MKLSKRNKEGLLRIEGLTQYERAAFKAICEAEGTNMSAELRATIKQINTGEWDLLTGKKED